MLSEAERSLMLICARQNLPADGISRARGLAQGALDWERLAGHAWRHGVAPLLFHHLQALESDGSVSAGPMHHLRQGYVRSAFRSQIHAIAITEILSEAERADLELMLLKGAALARTAYPDPALRPFADIDLLIREAEVEKARQILVALGYKIAPELLSESFNRRYHHNLPFVRRRPHPVHIELHWRLSDPFALIDFDHDRLFSRARLVPHRDGAARVLRREDKLVYLACHLDNHGYLNRYVVDRPDSLSFVFHPLSGNRLIWFTDLHELIAAGLDWPEVISTARNADALGALAVSLRLVRDVLGTPVDDDILEQFALAPMRWPEKVLGNYVLPLTKKERAPEAERFHKRFLATRKGFELRLIRLPDLWQYIFPPESMTRPASPMRSLTALLRCGAMFFELLWRRALRLGAGGRP